LRQSRIYLKIKHYKRLEQSDALESTISTLVSTWVAFDVPQSIFHCGSEATPATAAESGLFVLSSGCCKELKRDRVLPDRQHYYEHPSSYGQPESADRLP
jgi:hypothetical protein